MPAYLNVVTKFDDKALKAAEGQLKNFGKVVAGIAAAATAAIGAIAVGSVKEFAKFDAALVKSQAIMGDLTDALKTDMANTAREVAKTTTFSAEQAAESYFFLASAGLDAAASIKAMPQVAKFAQAGMFDMALATDLLTDAQSALGMVVKEDANENLKEMARLSDVLVRANTLANASVEQFSVALTTKAGASMRQFGIDAEEGVAVLAALADQGIKAELAGTNLSIAYRDLTSKALANKEAFAEAGVAVFDSSGEFRNMADVISDLERATAGMSDEQKKATFTQLGFSDKSMGTLAALIGTSDAIRKYEAELRNASGFTEDVAAKQLESMTSQFQLLKSRVLDVGISIGSQLAPTLLELGEKILPLIDKAGPALIALFIALTPAIEGILQLLPLLIELLVPVIEGLGVVIRDILNPAMEGMFGFIANNLPVVATFAGVFGTLAGAVYLYSNAAKIAAAAQVILTAVMGVNPLYLLALAVAAVAAGIVYLATQTTFFQDTWKAVTTFIADAWNTLWEDHLKPVLDAIAEAFKFVFEKVIQPIMTAFFITLGLLAALFEWVYETAIEPILRNIGIGFENLVENVVDPATQFIEKAFEMVGDAFKWVYENLIQPALDALGEGFQWVFDNIISPVSKTIEDTVENVGQTFKDVFQGVSDFMSMIFNGLVDIIKVPLNAIIDLINQTINGLNTIRVDIPSWVPEVGGRSIGFNLPNIPRLAEGGIVMPRPGGVLANLAEAGKPEAVIPLDRMGSMGNTYNVTINAGVGSDPVSIGRYVVDAIKRYESVSGKVFAGA